MLNRHYNTKSYYNTKSHYIIIHKAVEYDFKRTEIMEEKRKVKAAIHPTPEGRGLPCGTIGDRNAKN